MCTRGAEPSLPCHLLHFLSRRCCRRTMHWKMVQFKPFFSRNLDSRSAISRLFRSENGKCVLPRMPISGRCTTVTSPPRRFTASLQSLAIARRTRQVVLARIRRRLLRNVVAVEDDDRDLRELHELRQRHADRLQRAAGARHRRRHFAFREDEVAARFIGNDGADISALDRGAPARAATL